ncbi:uncharacterized protein LOC143218944 [Lasioglossum baleicum]|uniref:uncharacterized protein LOC143218944 n=1 Tax=Lasioglossum baleicum TaxID=434251 RepID=UPI003FCE4A67
MTILCAVAGLLQLVTLLVLTGFLFSLAAVTRLMELTVSLIYPVTIFILRQSSKLVVLMVSRSATLTSKRLGRLCTMDCGTATLVINLRAPNVDYARSVIPGLVAETVPVVDMAQDNVEPIIPIEPIAEEISETENP